MNPNRSQSCRCALALALGLVTALAPNLIAGAPHTKEILELTGGRRVKVVWIQGKNGPDRKVMYYDSKADAIKELPLPEAAPSILTRDGRCVVLSLGKAPDERRVLVHELDSGKTTEFPAGPGNNLLEVWQDPKSKRTWIYVNDFGDKGEAWNQSAGAIYRFPADKPDQRELVWDRTSSHFYLMLSEDGTRACFEPSWSNIGQLKFAFTSDGKIDQGNSEYKTFGGGCFPSLAPDNSYRLFRLDGDHRSITMHDADGGNARKISVADIPGVKDAGKGVWLTRWATHPRYMTQMAPDSDSARIYLGRFDEKFTKIGKWAAVSEEGAPKCFNSHAWVEPDN